tara:strand:- start:326 stop:1036 length:711 start_codon:yes stop_codon:yes gene_type:complete
MKIFKNIFNYFGYSITRKHKTENIEKLIQLRLNANPCDCLLDIGSNVGDFIKDYNAFFSKTYSFEPNPELIPELKKRFVNNKQISIFELGVGKNCENLDLYVTNDKGKTLSSIKKQNKVIHEILRNTKVIQKKKIKVISLSDFILNNKLEDKTFFLKTDTQGNDLEVLIGLKKFISNVKFIKIEMPVINIYNINYKYHEIDDFMKKNNFVPLHFQHLTRNKYGELVEYDVIFERLS